MRFAECLDLTSLRNSYRRFRSGSPWANVSSWNTSSNRLADTSRSYCGGCASCPGYGARGRWTANAKLKRTTPVTRMKWNTICEFKFTEMIFKLFISIVNSIIYKLLITNYSVILSDFFCTSTVNRRIIKNHYIIF